MKILDVAGTGIKKAAGAAAARVTAALAPAPGRSREADEELRRRAEINARGAAQRAARDEALFGATRWLGRRPGWLDRRR